jgi:polysaccharide export outer membrane protein
MKIPSLLVVVLFVGWMLGGCGRHNSPATITTQILTPTTSVVTKGAYRIKGGDKLLIRNLNWSSELFPDPSQTVGAASGGFTVFVRSDGNIILPEAGQLNVEGFTRQALADTLSMLYQDVVRNPLFEVQVANLQVKVLGSVNAQGLIALDKDFLSLGEILAKSGGINYGEASNTIQIIRGEGTQKQVIEYDFEDLGNPLIMNQNVYDNDIVYVPPSRGSLRGIQFQRGLVFAQPVITALNLTLIILNFINR